MSNHSHHPERKAPRSTSTPSRVDAARRMFDEHYLFTRLSTKTRDELFAGAQLLRMRSRATLFRAGEPAQSLHLLLDGALTLFRTSGGGQERVIDIVYPGEAVAEHTLFIKDRSYPVSATAARPCAVLAVPAAPYLRALRSQPTVCFDVLANLSTRLHSRLAELDDLAMRPAPQRVLRYLLDQLPPRAQHAAEIQLGAPKRVIASKLAIQPETFSRVLRRLTETGTIEVKGRTIVVRDPRQLQAAHFDSA